jgi:hypothetical protein
MNDYEIRFIKGGLPTLIFHPNASSDQEAIEAILSMHSLDYNVVEIWQDARRVHAENHDETHASRQNARSRA